MYRNNDFMYEAISKLEELTNIPIEIDSSRPKYDALLSIHDIQFAVEVKSTIRTSNQAYIISQLNDIRNNSNRPIIIISEYISKAAAEDLKRNYINYIDVAGNAFIRHNQLLIYTEGQKKVKKEKTNQSRAFQETGIKIIFNLLSAPENLQCSYRELAHKTGVSIGSVSNVMNELESLNFILKTDTKRVLKNEKELLDRWVIAYSDVLKPRLIRKRMKFRNVQSQNNWSNVNIRNLNDVCLWGGEAAGAIITGYLSPDKFDIYTNGNWQDLINSLGLVPDEEGNVEVKQIFWNENSQFPETSTVPALLVYADLITSGYNRNIETANLILENELQYIK
jgi:hypothetical protein